MFFNFFRKSILSSSVISLAYINRIIASDTETNQSHDCDIFFSVTPPLTQTDKQCLSLTPLDLYFARLFETCFVDVEVDAFLSSFLSRPNSDPIDKDTGHTEVQSEIRKTAKHNFSKKKSFNDSLNVVFSNTAYGLDKSDAFKTLPHESAVRTIENAVLKPSVKKAIKIRERNNKISYFPDILSNETDTSQLYSLYRKIKRFVLSAKRFLKLILTNILYILLKCVSSTIKLTPKDTITHRKFILSKTSDMLILKPTSPKLHNFNYNFASASAGARVVAFSSEVSNPNALLHNPKDSYIKTLCTSPTMFIIGFHEPISLHAIEFTSSEPFSSYFDRITVYSSMRYPTEEWKHIATVELSALKESNLFYLKPACENLPKEACWTSYIKFEVLSYYEIHDINICTLSQVKVFGSTQVQNLENKTTTDRNLNLQTQQKMCTTNLLANEDFDDSENAKFYYSNFQLNSNSNRFFTKNKYGSEINKNSSELVDTYHAIKNTNFINSTSSYFEMESLLADIKNNLQKQNALINDSLPPVVGMNHRMELLEKQQNTLAVVLTKMIATLQSAEKENSKLKQLLHTKEDLIEMDKLKHLSELEFSSISRKRLRTYCFSLYKKDWFLSISRQTRHYCLEAYLSVKNDLFTKAEQDLVVAQVSDLSTFSILRRKTPVTEITKLLQLYLTLLLETFFPSLLHNELKSVILKNNRRINVLFLWTSMRTLETMIQIYLLISKIVKSIFYFFLIKLIVSIVKKKNNKKLNT